ncbi:MAG: hypothetical protein OMM_04414 [Candidatus Magnetoglobus multicellularis str. Araruama]|uniref:Uncharacterized protein n=1 Tax=Candidatus Magnetoglobus multicellularis str. Araruama TaxID=890399 RepID=A0A1V1P1K3_9BACT|nr:MAG: hypothetical protein OMM_04414 [Candidatus Magnetoglobus multicellularis str. Araruama]
MANKITSTISQINSAISGVDIRKLYDVIAAMSAIVGLSDTTKGSSAKMDFGISNETFSDLKKYAKYLQENTDELQEYIDKQQTIINNTGKLSKEGKVARVNLTNAIKAQTVSQTMDTVKPDINFKQFGKALSYTNDVPVGKEFDKDLLNRITNIHRLYAMIRDKYKEINKEMLKRYDLLSKIDKKTISKRKLEILQKELIANGSKISTLEKEAKLLNNTAIKYKQIQTLKKQGQKVIDDRLIKEKQQIANAKKNERKARKNN